MRVIVPSLLVASSALALLPSTTQAALRINGWYPCGSSTLGDAAPSDHSFQCAEITVPLCHKGVCESKKEIEIFVKRLPATDAAAPPKAVWMLQGGPGMSSVALESSLKGLHTHLNGSASLYTMDHRGVGRSFFLQCDAAQAYSGGSPSGASLSPEETGNCIRDILFQIDNQTAAFSVTSAANDMALLVGELNAKEDVYIYGASYGTYFTERVMHLAPPNVKGYILDGVVMEDAPYFSSGNTDRITPTTHLAQFCEEDAKCAAMFQEFRQEKSTVLNAWEQIMGGLDKLKEGENLCVDLFRKPVPSLVSDDVKIAMSGWGADPNMRTFLPLAVRLLGRCDGDKDVAELKRIVALGSGGAAERKKKSLLHHRHLEELVAEDSQLVGSSSSSSRASSTSDSGSGSQPESRRLDDLVSEEQGSLVASGSGSQPATPVTPAPPAGPATLDVVSGTSDFLMFLIKNSEMWAVPSPTWEDEMKLFRSTVFPAPMVGDFLYKCLFSGSLDDPSCTLLKDPSVAAEMNVTALESVEFAYKRDQYWGKFASVPEHASVVVINGKLDFATVSNQGVRQYENFQGGRGKMMVEFDFGVHCSGIAGTTPNDATECGLKIMASYIAANGDVEAVDTSCMDTLPAIEFPTV